MSQETSSLSQIDSSADNTGKQPINPDQNQGLAEHNSPLNEQEQAKQTVHQKLIEFAQHLEDLAAKETNVSHRQMTFVLGLSVLIGSTFVINELSAASSSPLLTEEQIKHMLQSLKPESMQELFYKYNLKPLGASEIHSSTSVHIPRDVMQGIDFASKGEPLTLEQFTRSLIANSDSAPWMNSYQAMVNGHVPIVSENADYPAVDILSPEKAAALSALLDQASELAIKNVLVGLTGMIAGLGMMATSGLSLVSDVYDKGQGLPVSQAGKVKVSEGVLGLPGALPLLAKLTRVIARAL